MTELPTDFPETSFFADHLARTKAIFASYPTITVATDLPDYLQPFIDYTRLRWMVPAREWQRLDYQWGPFCEATIGYQLPDWQWRTVSGYKPSADDDAKYSQWFEISIPAWGEHAARVETVPAELVNNGGAPPKPWPDGAYSLLHGYNARYEAWLATLSKEARMAEVGAVCDRFQAEYTLFVEGILYFQILWPNPADPQLVTPATWDKEGKAIAQRYNHREPAKEHWLLPIAEMFAIYNPSKLLRYVHPEGGRLSSGADEPARHESIARPAIRTAGNGKKPTPDLE